MNDRILVIDSDNTIQKQLIKNLSLIGLKISHLHAITEITPQEATSKYKLIICDYSQLIDDQIWLQFIEGANQLMPMIVLVDSDSKQILANIIRLGFRGYLLKPLTDMSILRKTVKNTLNAITEIDLTTEGLIAENKKLVSKLLALQEDQEAGQYIQLKLFPETPVDYANCKLAHRILPSFYLSGDFIDYFAIDEDCFVFYLADVSGHGASSAFVTMLLKLMTNKIRNQVTNDPQFVFSPDYFLSTINDELLRMNLGKHLSLFCGMINTKEQLLTVSVAAHYPPALLVQDNQVTDIIKEALPLGLFKKDSYETMTFRLNKVFSLFLFSDGILDILPQDSLKEKEHYLSILTTKCKTLSQVEEHLGMHSLSQISDDIAILAITTNKQPLS